MVRCGRIGQKGQNGGVMVMEDTTWVMHGLEWEHPACIHSYEELIKWIDEVGFVPLFRNEIQGFSVEEHTASRSWWTGDKEKDPWEWREIIARSGKVAYGKFFHKKSGFISLKWFPYFANYRRDGYDFDARWEDGLASMRCKKIMDKFEERKEWMGRELKVQAGFGKGGEKNFDGIVAELQMQTYFTIRDFRRKRNKKGMEYGMAVSVYASPEEMWGYDMVSSAYGEKPERSKERIVRQIRKLYPCASEKQIEILIK